MPSCSGSFSPSGNVESPGKGDGRGNRAAVVRIAGPAA